MMKALVVGGTGPTGPFIVNGLRDRGYQVVILHRGSHEIDEIPEDVEHIHADPHFRETLSDALSARTFDLCVASYGRTRYVAEVLAGRVARLIAISGMTYRATADPALVTPRGGGIPLGEEDARPSEEEHRFVYMIGHSEQVIRGHHAGATIFRYPYVYGPHQVVPREWSIVRRLKDGRRTLLLPEGGLTLVMHGYAGNMAAAVLAAVDRPRASTGRTYNVGDERQLSLRQIVEIIATTMEVELEILSVPMAVAGPARVFLPHGRIEHLLTDIGRAKADLAYRDVITPTEAIARTVRWYLDHPPAPGGAIERALADPFDYAAEDRLAAVAREARARMATLDVGLDRRHPYAHPEQPGWTDHRGR